MIDFLIKSSVCLVVFLTFYHLVLEREKTHRFNRFYLIITLILSLVIPFVTYEIIEIIPVQASEPIFIPQFENIPTTTIVEQVNYIPIILWSLYGIITTLFMLRFVKNIWKLIQKSKSNTTINYKNATLVLVEEKTLPHSFLNYIFINADDYNNQTIEDELYTHELVHVTQKHTLDILFIELLKCVFWFNPLVYFYKKAIQLNHEFLADEKVVTSYNNVTFYQNLLLQKSSNVQTIYLASNLNYLVTKKRLLMMTKNTSKKLALVKKMAIVPILAGLIYFFCIEIVAQEKTINTNTETTNSNITDKDKIRDSYYSNVRIILKDLRTNSSINKMYEDLTLEEKRNYLNWVPDIIIENEIPEPLFEKMKTKNMAVWINGKASNKEEIKKHKRTDFSYYTYSFVHENARSKRFPQEYQYTLYTKDYFDENLKNSNLHFSNDTLKMVVSESEKAWKKVSEILNPKKVVADTVVWYTQGKEGYNLYVNDSVKKKKNTTTKRKENIEIKKVDDTTNLKNYKEKEVKKLNDFNPGKLKNGYIYMTNKGTFFFVKNDDTIEYYNRLGYRVNENGEELIKRDVKNLIDLTEQPEYEGGIQKFLIYIKENYKTPEEIKKQKLKGKIFVDFIIEKDGSLTNITILRDIGFGSGEEAQRVLKSSPKWKPGKIKEEIVRVKYVLPINISGE